MLDCNKLDINKVKADLKVEEQAIYQAGNNLPDSNDKNLDAPQQKIIQFFIQKISDARSSAQEHLNYKKTRRQEIESHFPVNFDEIPKNLENSVNRIQQNRKNRIKEYRKRERESLIKLEAFKRDHKRKWNAKYPASKVLHWSIIALFVLIESSLNAYFFSKGSDLGLLGGLLEALLVSISNVGSALIIGVLVLPTALNHIDKEKRNTYKYILIFYAIIMVAFNLLTGHYRVKLESEPFSAMTQAFYSFIHNPLGIDNFDAWLLVLIGSLFLIFALIKGYTSDDPYPGYGHLDREYKKNLLVYENEKELIIRDVNVATDKAKNEVSSLLQRARNESREYQRINDDCENIIHELNNCAKFYELTCDSILKEYRNINMEIRRHGGGKPPEYFNQDFRIDENLFSLESDHPSQDTVTGKIQGFTDNIELEAKNAFNEILKSNNEFLENVDAHIRAIENNE